MRHLRIGAREVRPLVQGGMGVGVSAHRLAAAVSETPGVYLLDRTSDPSHNRSVLTFAGTHSRSR